MCIVESDVPRHHFVTPPHTTAVSCSSWCLRPVSVDQCFPVVGRSAPVCISVLSVSWVLPAAFFQTTKKVRLEPKCLGNSDFHFFVARESIVYCGSSFCRAMLCYMLSSCVCLCVCHTPVLYQTAKRKIMEIMPYDSKGTLVFWCQRSRRNSTGITPSGGAKCRWG